MITVLRVTVRVITVLRVTVRVITVLRVTVRVITVLRVTVLRVTIIHSRIDDDTGVKLDFERGGENKRKTMLKEVFILLAWDTMVDDKIILVKYFKRSARGIYVPIELLFTFLTVLILLVFLFMISLHCR